ncbi:putative signal-transduction protein containing cAMP-binding and CBS domains [Metallosphaera yellowstonensis MK1]|jgi:CBS domain-containing protein|uniref:Putative signal-transduction protein containing cAMP-binding and CBS domains n=1 Tax=Metallosphaera yellowstonensis MK1 TaxID=671065 RepID=H2C3H3_9CREN|nr:CBS domain-containing protein [Metallosphaera yellowstonensis]EHP70794.1 putative signal-transduction protein containing cAMP-binding and CBS domains [Metallosphaera yellowstonensis MK1]
MTVKVSQVSSRLVKVIRDEDPVFLAAAEMRNHNMGSMLVVDNKGKVVGIITERDVVRAAAEKRVDSRVSEYMTEEVKGVTEDTTVEEALAVMLENGFRHLPVVGKDGKVTGIISIRDLAKALTDSHFLQYGKEWVDVKGSGMICPVCGLEIDEYGYCNCGTGSS